MDSWDRTYLEMKQFLSRLYRKETKQKNFDSITLISKSGTNKCIKFTQNLQIIGIGKQLQHFAMFSIKSLTFEKQLKNYLNY